MRRLSLLAVLLLVPAAHAATGPTNGCPAPCSGQVSSPSRHATAVRPAGRSRRRGRRLRPGHGSARASAAARRSPRPTAPRMWLRAARLRDTVVAALPRRGRDALRTGWSSTGAGSSRASRRTAASPRSRGSPAARAPDGGHRRRTSSRSAIVHRLELRGDFEVETVSRDGKRLFLIEHLPSAGSPRYSVRLFDLSHDRLASKPLRGEGEPSVMAGLAWSGVGSPDGRWLLTLYLNTGRNVAFVHALDLVRSSPLCIFLPSGRRVRRAQALRADALARRAAARRDERGARCGRRDRPGDPEGRAHRTLRRDAEAAAAPARSRARSRGTGARSTSARDGTSGPTTPRTGSCAARIGPAVRSRASASPLGDRRVHALRADGRMLTFDAATGADRRDERGTRRPRERCRGDDTAEEGGRPCSG